LAVEHASLTSSIATKSANAHSLCLVLLCGNLLFEMGPGISVFFPAYNDAASIGALVTEALNVLPTLTHDFEVIVINDGSTDGTQAQLEALASSHSQVRIIQHVHNQGYGAALRSGFASAQKELIFYTDGDGQYDVREISALYPLLTSEVDVVNGFKIKRADSRQRKVIGGLYNSLARLCFLLPIRDVDCDFRLLRRSAVAPLKLTVTSGAICVELVHQLHRNGCRFAEAPVHHYPRPHGRSEFFTPSRVIHTAFDFLRLWLRAMLWRSN
jgi:glycosyltransferase involved in cell wall biosynthesis